ncbi:sulfotransferase [Spiribacter halobius]|uniref:sulfotransferase n=1 Tax=Sediminicurvatus halobius TaxID=2182432 RepID=UPI001304B435|nr:sulfotransferase [Spiribacter halobius]UEX78713.1 sulfotransferase [Spiribacter halobius]
MSTRTRQDQTAAEPSLGAARLAGWGRALDLLVSALLPPRDGIARLTLRHALSTLALLVLLPIGLAYHWLGFALDEILFRGYRRLPVRAPLFILGVPRSGTTALHHLLAHDPRLTTMRTWECLFAPAISWRYLWRGIARLDARLGSPGAWLVNRAASRLSRGLEGVHPIGLDAPEEDYLALLPRLSCFILVVAFPDAPGLWRLGRGDHGLTGPERRRLMAAYRRCIQRHLYFHGGHRRYLAKNAAFAPLAGSLLEAFPDARVIACLREPAGALSSQLASLDPALSSLHGPYRRDVLRERMISQLGLGYDTLLEQLPRLPAGRAVLLPLPAQRRGLAAAVRACYRELGLPLAPPLKNRLAAADAAARHHRSGHRHQLAHWNLDAASVRHRFADVTALLDLTGEYAVPAHRLPSRPPQPPRDHHGIAVITPAPARRHRLGCRAGA